jgi:p-hydroxybenzoate 3-monooxygenase
MRTQVAIVGAGPAGLVLARLLELSGIDSVVLEARSREYVEQRIRAGVLEHDSARLLEEAGVGDRLKAEGLVHEGIELRFAGEGHRIDFPALTGGRHVVLYGQTEVVKDLIEARVASGAPLCFEATDVALHGIDSDHPRVTYRHDGADHELECDAIAGCDGFHGVCRRSFPDGMLTTWQRDYPFGWLGILAAVAPSTDELIYAHSERGFALHSMRSLELSRLYVQCDPRDDVADWPDERVWEELHARLALDGWSLQEGPVLDKGITPMRSFVAEPLRCGRLFLAGDAAHIVPPTGAKGLNLAVHDVRLLAEALIDHFAGGRDGLLDAYSDAALKRVWRAEHFSWWMTSMLHRFPDDDAFGMRLQESQLEYVCRSPAAAASLAENYVGAVVGYDGGKWPPNNRE